MIPRIKAHGGLLEAIIVRHDTMEVIEGNSRLAAYRNLRDNDRDKSGKWDSIACLVVSCLTRKQQYAYLNQIHVEGKTPWIAYEKANLVYSMKKELTDDEILHTLGITSQELAKRIRVIEMMTESSDMERSHFSHYDVLVRTRKIAEELAVNPDLTKILVSKIVDQDKEGSDFTAQALRDKLPTIIGKKKVLKKYIDGRQNLDEAFLDAKLSGVHQT